MTSKRILAATVYVDGKPYLAGTSEADLPAGVAGQITNEGAWRTDDAATADDPVPLAGGSDKPDGRASEAVWRAYAVSQGVPEDKAAGLSKDELRDRFR